MESLYSNLVLYNGTVPGHSTPTVLPIEEAGISENDGGRPAVVDKSRCIMQTD